MTMSLPIVIVANSTRATTAKATPGLAKRVFRQPLIEGDPGQDDADRRDGRAGRLDGVSVSPRMSTASTTVRPPYAATIPLTTAIGPMRRPVK